MRRKKPCQDSCSAGLQYNGYWVSLESELVTYSYLDYLVLAGLVAHIVLEDLAQTEVVTTIDVDGDSGNLVRNTHGDSNVNLIAVVFDRLVEVYVGVFILQLIFQIGTCQEAKLNTSLDGKALEEVNVSNNRKIQIAKRNSCRPAATLNG